MVGSDIAVIAPTTVRFIADILAQFRGTSQMPNSSLWSEDFTITNTTYQVLTKASVELTGKYTIDLNGVLTVVDIWLDLITNNSANGRCKLQISGDGGTTWVDVTGDIDNPPGAVPTNTTGPGLWISSIQTGTEKLQFQILGKSTDGLAATIRIYNTSYLYLIYNKTLT